VPRVYLRPRVSQEVFLANLGRRIGIARIYESFTSSARVILFISSLKGKAERLREREREREIRAETEKERERERDDGGS